MQPEIKLIGKKGHYTFNPHDSKSLITLSGMANLFKGNADWKDKNETLKTVAIKVKRIGLQIVRFTREAKITIENNHTNLLKGYDYIEKDGIYYIISEFHKGSSLAKKISLSQSINRVSSEKIIADICQALKDLHKRRIIHRDVKPSNIMLAKDGVSVLIDYGAVKMMDETETLGSFLGTIEYAPPEQIDFKATEKINESSDIYALGITYYEMLTGQLPFTGTNEEIEKQKKNKLPPHSELSKKEYEFILKATAARQQDRFKNVDEFLAAFNKVYKQNIFISFIEALKKKLSELKGWVPSWKLSIPKKTIWAATGVIVLLVASSILFYKQHQKNKDYSFFIGIAVNVEKMGDYNRALDFYKDADVNKKTEFATNKIVELSRLTDALQLYYKADYKTAFEMFTSAAALGSGPANYYLGELTYNGLGTPRDFDSGQKYTQAAINSGFGMAYWRKGLVASDKSPSQAINYYKLSFNSIQQLADARDPEALVNLSDLYLIGGRNSFNLQRDTVKAKDCLYNAVNKGFVLAMSKLGNLYQKSNADSSVKWYSIAADKGDPKAQYAFSALLLEKKSPGDTANARQWLNRSVEQNYPDAFTLAAKIDDSNGRFAEAKSHYEQALRFDNQNATAMIALGATYEKGKGTDTNYLKAYEYYKSSLKFAPDSIPVYIALADLFKKGGYYLNQSNDQYINYLDLAARTWAAKDPSDGNAFKTKSGFEQFRKKEFGEARISFIEASRGSEYQIANKMVSYIEAKQLIKAGDSLFKQYN